MSQYVCTASQLAHYVVDKCTKDGKPVSNLQLQKILYFMQVVFLKNKKEFIFEDEFQAWPYGPVLPKVYSEYSCFGGYPIEQEYDDIPSDLLGEHKEYLDVGIKYLRGKAPWDLVNIAHRSGSPWHTIWNSDNGYKKAIPNGLLVKCSSSDNN